MNENEPKHTGELQDETLPREAQESTGHDAFLSYTRRPDRARARQVEAFLESIHQLPISRDSGMRPLRICRDGSDFSLPAKRDGSSLANDDPVWRIIQSELEKSRFLIVLCSPGAVLSKWMAKEIQWFLTHRGEESILLAVTEGEGAEPRPEEIFPTEILKVGLHRKLIWYDLRGLGRLSLRSGGSNAEDELVRLASDLLAWDAERQGPLAAIWQRERLRQQRRQATAVLAAGIALLVLAGIAAYQAVRSRQATERARANAIVTAAESSADPLEGALLLAELADRDEPPEGMRVAQKLAGSLLPVAVLRGHVRALRSLSFSPDGRWLATLAADGTVKSWPADGNGDPQILADRVPQLERIAFGPTGTWIAAHLAGGSVRIFHTGTRDTLDLPCDSGASWSFSRDGRWIATVSSSGEAAVCRTDQAVRRALGIPGQAVLATQWSQDNAVLWLAADDGSTWKIDLAVGDSLPQSGSARAAPRKDRFTRAVFNPDGSRVLFATEREVVAVPIEGGDTLIVPDRGWDINSIDLAGSRALIAYSDATAWIWSVEDGFPVRRFDAGTLDLALDSPFLPSGEPREPTSDLIASFSPGGARVMTFASDSETRIWNAGGEGASGSLSDSEERMRWLRFTLRGQPGIEVAVFRQDGGWLATGSDDGSVRVWHLQEPDEPHRLLHPGPVNTVTFSPSGGMLLTVTRDERARLWVGNREIPLPIDSNSGEVTAALFAGKRVLTAHRSGVVRIWDVSGMKPRLERALRPHPSAIRSLRIFPDRERVVSLGSDGTIRIWWVDQQKDPVEMTRKVPDANSIELSRDGKRILAIHPNAATIWNVDGSGAPLIFSGPGPGTLNQVSFSPDGQSILMCSFTGAMIWSVDRKGMPVHLPSAAQAEEGWGVGEFSPNGREVAAGSLAGRLWVWRANGKGEPRVLRQSGELAHIGPVSSLSFDRDGTRLVTTGGMDGRAMVWNVDGSGNPVVIRQGGALTDAEFSPDGSRVASASENGPVFVSRVRWRDLARYLGSETSATLTVEQRILRFGESYAEARDAYEQAERKRGRTPLPETWSFEYPF